MDSGCGKPNGIVTVNKKVNKKLKTMNTGWSLAVNLNSEIIWGITV